MSIYRKQKYYVGWGLAVQLLILAGAIIVRYFEYVPPFDLSDRYFFWFYIAGLPLMVIGPLGGWKFFGVGFTPSMFIFVDIPVKIYLTILTAALTYLQLEHNLTIWISAPALFILGMMSLADNKCPRCNMPIRLRSLERRNPGVVDAWNFIEYRAWKCEWCNLELKEDYFAEQRDGARKFKAGEMQLEELSESEIFNIAAAKVLSKMGKDMDGFIKELNELPEGDRNLAMKELKAKIDDQVFRIRQEYLEGEHLPPE